MISTTRWIGCSEKGNNLAFYDADDAAIYYEQSGEGKPAVMLHGYALNGLMWSFQKESVTANHKMIAVDLRGFGQSSCNKRWSSDIMAEDIAGLIESLDLHDCTIVGFSMSGPVAVKLALGLPQRIGKLALVSSILPSTGRARNEKERNTQRKERDLLTLRGVNAWADAMGIRKGPLVGNIFQRNPESKEVWEQMLSRHNPDFLGCMMEARESQSENIDWRARLSEIKQQTMIIVGAQDARFIDASKYMARTIPGARLEIISGAGHIVNLERPDEFNRIFREFLDT